MSNISSRDYLQKLEVQIFDRYGKLIFWSNKVDFEWDVKD